MDQKYMGTRLPFNNRPNKKAILAVLGIVIVVVGLIIMTIVILVSRNKEPDPLAIQDAGQNARSSLADAAEITNGWKSLETVDYKIKMVDGWNFTLFDGNVLFSDCEIQECYEINEGEDATITEKSGANASTRGAYFVVQPSGYDISKSISGYRKSQTFEVGFTLYTREQTTTSTDDLDGALPVGSSENILIRNEPDGRFSYIYYSVLPEQRDPTLAILAMASTFELKK